MTPQTPPTDRPLTAGDWIEWHGGENPAPDQKIHWRNAHGAEHGPVLSNEVCGFGFPSMPGSATIIAYRLARPATSAASEGEGKDDAISLFETVCEYLLGEGPLRGQQFGDEPPTMKSGYLARYWWRHDLREARGQIIAALASPPISERERELEGALREARQNLIDCGDHFGAGRVADALTAQPAGEPSHV